MKNLLFTVVLALACFSLMSCDEDNDNAMPNIYEGFTYSPSKPVPGDSVTITAKVKQRGNHQYGSKYTWTVKLSVDDNGTSRDSVQTIVQGPFSDGSQYKDAQVTVKIPDNAISSTKSGMTNIAYVTFKNESNNAVDGEEYGTYSGNTGEGCTGNITSMISTLYSRANGSFQFRVY